MDARGNLADRNLRLELNLLLAPNFLLALNPLQALGCWTGFTEPAR
jgi:hypothetical protein